MALVCLLAVIWFERRYRWFFDSDEFEDVCLNACVAAVALPHIGLLSLARLHRRFEWIRFGTVAAVVALAGVISAMILIEPRYHEDEWFRVMGILAILTASGTIAVPILHRISTLRAHEEIQTVELSLSLTCPRCERVQELPVGRSKCVGCGLRFVMEIEEAHCRKCGYPLYKLQSAVCPECGTPIAESASAEPGN